jgi:hypothetical protein
MEGYEQLNLTQVCVNAKISAQNALKLFAFQSTYAPRSRVHLAFYATPLRVTH